MQFTAATRNGHNNMKPSYGVRTVATWTPADVHVIRDGDANIVASLGYSTGEDALMHQGLQAKEFFSPGFLSIYFGLILLGILVIKYINRPEENFNFVCGTVEPGPPSFDYSIRATNDFPTCQYCRSTVLPFERACSHCGAAV
jgi:hypothetical protein